MDAQLVSKMGLQEMFLRNFIGGAVLMNRDKGKQLDGNVTCKRGWEEPLQDAISGGRLQRKITTHSVFLTHGFQTKQNCSIYFPPMEISHFAFND